MSSEQQAYEALALSAMAIGSFLRPIGGKRQRCVCGALEGESCRDHSQVMAFMFDNDGLCGVEQGSRVLWRRGSADMAEESD